MVGYESQPLQHNGLPRSIMLRPEIVIRWKQFYTAANLGATKSYWLQRVRIFRVNWRLRLTTCKFRRASMRFPSTLHRPYWHKLLINTEEFTNRFRLSLCRMR